MLEFLPFAVAVALIYFAERNWKQRPIRRPTDGAVFRLLWTITAIALIVQVVLWTSIWLIDPSLVGGGAWIAALSWLLVTVAAGKFAMWPVAWRVAESGVEDGALPPAVLWGASACVWFGVLRLTGALVSLSMGMPDLAIDGLLFLFGGFSVLERSRGWRTGMVVLWGLFGLAGLLLMGKTLAAMAGAGTAPVMQAGSAELDSPGLALIFSAVLALAGLSIAAALGGSSARAWCTGRMRAGKACAGCGYNLIGIDATRCPECGNPVRVPGG